MTSAKAEKMRSDKPCLGTWLSSGSPVVAELAARCGFDWLLLDMEHGCLPEAELLANLRAAGSGDVCVVVRVPTHEAGLIGRALDWGADAIMVPHVETAAEAGALVRAMRYPPDGSRGYSRSVRAYGYGLIAPETRAAPMLFAQIESVKGIANVDAIAGVDGVEVLFVGPADLKLSLSTAPAAPSYLDALDSVIRAAKAHAVRAGILVRDRGDTETLVKQGFTKIAVDSDLSILRAGFLSIGSFGGTD
ncbi:MAG: aldolase/citrate lyase family protein [Verrucomicrobiota bacterium]